jgi:hypothetical protein
MVLRMHLTYLELLLPSNRGRDNMVCTRILYFWGITLQAHKNGFIRFQMGLADDLNFTACRFKAFLSSSASCLGTALNFYLRISVLKYTLQAWCDHKIARS